MHPLAHPWPSDGCPSLAGSPDRTGATQTVRALESEQQQFAVQFLSSLTSLPSCPSFAAPTAALQGCLERLLRVGRKLGKVHTGGALATHEPLLADLRHPTCSRMLLMHKRARWTRLKPATM